MDSRAQLSLPVCNSVPCVLMRAGTSRGPFFLADWLPAEKEKRDRWLLAIMGSPHMLQLDGLGGANTLTSKVAVVSTSQKKGCDVDYLFAQVAIDKALVDTHPNCGNMLAGVAPFAIENGLIKNIGKEVTLVNVNNTNTGSVIQACVQTPGGKVTYAGNVAMDGVPGVAAPVELNFLDVWGKTTGKIFPDNGNRQSRIDGVAATLIDAGIPMMLLRATDLGLRGDESRDAIQGNLELLSRIETMRLQAGWKMGLGDVTNKVIPKPALLSLPSSGQTGISGNSHNIDIQSRYLTPHQCHASHSVTGAIGIATALLIPETLAHDLIFGGISRSGGHRGCGQKVNIIHPSGKVSLSVQCDTQGKIRSMGVVRTVRKIMEGRFFLPPHLF